MVGEGTEEELEKKEVPPQEDDEDEEGDGPSVAPGEGEFTGFGPLLFSPFSRAGGTKKKKKKKKPKKKKATQSDPPRVGLSKLFPSGVYPTGEICEYKDE